MHDPIRADLGDCALMGAVRLPDPLLPSDGVDAAALEVALREVVDGEVRFDDGSRATYATDASNYRQVPIGVVVPRTVEAASAALRVCARFGAPVLSRGGGTSLAGECCNVAVVIDWSKHCHRIEQIDADARTAVVEPGVVLDQLNAAAAEFDLMYGPKPATHAHCTIGGMIGNNSCGSSAQAYGKTVDNIRRLEVQLYDGTRAWVGGEGGGLDEMIEAGGRMADIARGLRDIAERCGDAIRERFPEIPRRVSGYNLDDLLAERGADLAKALCGSESTLVTVLRAEVTLVPVVPHRAFVLLGFDTIDKAADAVVDILPHEPLILEGLDGKLIDHERRKRMDPVGLQRLPEGGAWLIVQLGGTTQDDADAKARDLLRNIELAESKRSRLVDDLGEQALIMAVREDALGATAWVEGEHSTWPGWEDAAVAPELLGDYLRDFRRLLEEFDYGAASLYGHFGQGCVHTRITFELATLRGVQMYRRFAQRAAHLVADYGGSLSGEHGDGQARGELLPIMFGDEIVDAFREVKTLFDPTGRMNPGKVVDPAPLDANLRLGPGYAPTPTRHQQFAYPDDRGTFDNAALRCVGVGRCRNHEGGVMCPSYRATGEEEYSTRGRARLLFEMVNGDRPDAAIRDGWRSTEVRDALDLCLSCKGCLSDCPVDVDMATYKAEFLSHHYRHRIRPGSHYTMGWLPLWARLAHLAPRLVNRLSHLPGLSRLVKKLGGLEEDRAIPVFAPERFVDWYRARGPRGSGLRGEVVLWPDTFSNNMHPAVAKAAVEVLEDAGYRAVVPEATLCCGLTWISTGQLDVAKTVLRRTARALRPWLERGVPVIGLEPSCTAVFRSDGTDLLPADDDVRLLSENTKTLAELLAGTTGWTPPSLEGTALRQPHCHQHAVLGSSADEQLLAQSGVELESVGGCCGLAGNFGFEAGHLDVSVACAETELLPAIRAADASTVILADGFSCRTQVEQSGVGRQAVHLAELLAGGIHGRVRGDLPEDVLAERPALLQTIPPHRRGVTPFVQAVRDDQK